MKRVEAKKIAKSTIVKLMATLYTGKYGNSKQFEMWCKTYAAGGAEMHLKHYSYTLWVVLADSLLHKEFSQLKGEQKKPNNVNMPYICASVLSLHF